MRHSYATHLECSVSAQAYDIAKLHGLSAANKPLLARYDLEALRRGLPRQESSVLFGKARGGDPGAVERLRSLAGGGDAEAQFNLALMYERGRGVAPSLVDLGDLRRALAGWSTRSFPIPGSRGGCAGSDGPRSVHDEAESRRTPARHYSPFGKKSTSSSRTAARAIPPGSGRFPTAECCG